MCTKSCALLRAGKSMMAFLTPRLEPNAATKWRNVFLNEYKSVGTCKSSSQQPNNATKAGLAR